MKAARCAVGLLRAAGLLATGTCPASERAGTVTYAIDLNARADAKTVKVWFPYPTSDSGQAIGKLKFTGNDPGVTLSRGPVSGALSLYAEWLGPMRARTLTVSVHAIAREGTAGRLVESRKPVPPDDCRPDVFRYTIRFQEG